MNVKIAREPDDPICRRVSIGGNKEIGYYMFYRGSPSDILEDMEIVLRAFKISINTDNKREQDKREHDEPIHPIFNGVPEKRENN